MPRRAKHPKDPPNLSLSADRELERILTMQEASHFTSLSVDALKQHYGYMLLQLTPRRYGIKLKDCMRIGKKPAA